MAAYDISSLKKEKDFFIGIDSDGCVFDSMELKHKECFCPEFIYHFSLQTVSRYARQVWDFVNLYSKNRGLNRFLALVKAIDFLSTHPDVQKRSPSLPYLASLRGWVKRETKLGMNTLKTEITQNPDQELKRVYEWSKDVNTAVARMVKGGVPPFPYVKESMKLMTQYADTLVVSQTPFDTLKHEWEEQGIIGYMKAIAGQEVGNKAEQIAVAAKQGYKPTHMLMIGDAPGDLESAKANNVMFFPIIPGQEENSWKELYEEGLMRFFEEKYAGEYQESLIERFNKSLPSVPPWEEV
ncbi:HAD hydrolase-like protein [Spirochaetia bacterium 38H-sp]|uniref:HAD hydrolase-like protein n=1 Tax=Rarispira pelagica TaxID=3141764 RepID=A0ABU9UAB3_9SPIR